MHEIRVSIVSPEAADHGVAELWAGDKLIGYTVLEDTDLMLRFESSHLAGDGLRLRSVLSAHHCLATQGSSRSARARARPAP